ncbi:MULTISPECIES: SagB/ThcOx family dehydrogenase [unclassified Myroides]|uniref:SagB/ThcOx family dehydrogenase n=1 Tax=unclassified Myroides TaxID=2642485 RepID=UPI003D2F9734
MTQEDILNLLAEHQLSEPTLAFLDQIKFKRYDRESREKFTLISYVNNNPNLQKRIYEACYDVGFCPTFSLPSERNPSAAFWALNQLNKKRKSSRTFAIEPLTLQDISGFLQLFYTLTGCEIVDFKGTEITKYTRNIASGGALYATEIYVINHRIKELPLGAYRYNVVDFTLELVKPLDTKESMNAFYETIMKTPTAVIDFEQTSAFVVFSSILNKHSFKYKDFGVVLSLVEIGEFVHAAYLAGAALEIGCCVFGGILSNQLNELLELKSKLHQPFLCMAIGNLKKEEE